MVALAATAGLAACGGDEDGALAPGTQGSPTPGASTVRSDAPADSPLLSGTLPLLNGEEQSLEEFRGKVVLVVNTASECGYTPQFENLEALYEERRDDGLVVLGFPADDVAGQEPRDGEELAEFCEENFGVSFPMFAKSNVVSEPVNPLFERLAAEAGAPTWDFNKYLIDRDGEVVGRWDAGTEPDAAEITEPIDAAL